jgi:hypothetical protein
VYLSWFWAKVLRDACVVCLEAVFCSFESCLDKVSCPSDPITHESLR